MSTNLSSGFKGQIPNSNIIIDNSSFSLTKNETHYVLITHAHSDHLNGLSDSWNKGKIHCSNETKKLLSLMYPTLNKKGLIIGHAINSTFNLSKISSPNRRHIKITHKNNNNNKNSCKCE